MTKFASCEILYDSDGKVREFVDYTRTIYNTEIVPSFDDNDRFFNFFLLIIEWRI
ncbi:MAG: hypothetical protein L6V91_09700 [Bacilli bacterium]|nr:MAG: hypothetical protein L6V91_09700 [Bacilli bacterium]